MENFIFCAVKIKRNLDIELEKSIEVKCGFNETRVHLKFKNRQIVFTSLMQSDMLKDCHEQCEDYMFRYSPMNEVHFH